VAKTSYLLSQKRELYRTESFRGDIGVLFRSVLIVNRHERLNCEEADSEVLTMRNDMTTKDIFVDAGTGRIFLFEFLNYGIVDNVASFIYCFDIGCVRSPNDDV
jgi:hypothetical protein